MDLKAYLMENKQIYIRLKAMELSLVELRDEAFGDGSPSIDKLNVQTSLPSDPMAEAIIQYTDLLNDYRKLKRTYILRLVKSKAIIMKYAEDDKAKNMLLLRYIHYHSYGTIGKLYGLSYKEAQAAIRWELRKIINASSKTT